ncbi:FoF1 ATP synthase subunit gamma [Hydrogenobacter thermophilus]|uniref:F0F1 ATP synthase subunit gamma n=1 Tax=Hydrogenobacter thermophilus TaxID=940 RepID=UPI0030F7C3A7
MRLKDIDNKINHLYSVKKYINAMNLISINRYRRYYAQLSAQHRYFLRLREVLEMLIYLHRGDLFLKRKEKSLCLILLSTDRGFVGRFNEVLIRTVSDFLKHPPLEVKKVVIVGRRGAQQFKNMEKTETYTGVFGKDIDWGKAQEIFYSIVRDYMAGHYDAVYVALNRPILRQAMREEKAEREVKKEEAQVGEIFYELFKRATPTLPVAVGTVASYKPQIVKFIPPALEGSYSEKSIMNFEGDEEFILMELLRLYLYFLLRQIFLEHFSAELSARFIKTREIIRAIDKKVSQLSFERNKLRQERINNELLDLINIYISMKERLFKDMQDESYTLEVSKDFTEEAVDMILGRLGRRFHFKKVIRRDMSGWRVLSRSSMYDLTLESFLARLLRSLPYSNLWV